MDHSKRWRTSDGREIDQVEAVLKQIREIPTSRRIIWEGWNVGELDQMALPPCHKHYQFFVSKNEGLSLATVQRSADLVLGATWNVLNAALVAHLVAKETNLEPREIIWYGLDVHLYLNHIEQAATQINREPRPFPKLHIKRKADSLFDYRIEDLELEGYTPHAHIAAPVAV